MVLRMVAELSNKLQTLIITMACNLKYILNTNSKVTTPVVQPIMAISQTTDLPAVAIDNHKDKTVGIATSHRWISVATILQTLGINKICRSTSSKVIHNNTQLKTWYQMSSCKNKFRSLLRTTRSTFRKIRAQRSFTSTWNKYLRSILRATLGSSRFKEDPTSTISKDSTIWLTSLSRLISLYLVCKDRLLALTRGWDPEKIEPIRKRQGRKVVPAVLALVMATSIQVGHTRESISNNKIMVNTPSKRDILIVPTLIHITHRTAKTSRQCHTSKTASRAQLWQVAAAPRRKQRCRSQRSIYLSTTMFKMWL